MKTLYFDCFAGASGNMILGGLIALGLDADKLGREIDRLDISGISLKLSTVDRAGISSIHVEVDAPEQTKDRHLHNIEKIIDDSSLSDGVKVRAKSIFRRLAAAEAKIHGVDVQKVHFHEVGALDAIADVVGACIGFEMLGIERFVCSKIHVGSGFVTMEHGKYPVPPPAVAELLSGVPIYSTEIEGELITPTGAAIITTLCDNFGRMPEISVEKTGYGAGTRDHKGFPNVLRLMIGESTEETNAKDSDGLITEELVLLETNVDDVSPQVLGYVLDRSLELGALDVWFTPIQMKKDRPAATISVLCSKDLRMTMLDLLYAETTTLGVRVSNINRTSMPREVIAVNTPYGNIDVKVAAIGGRVINVMPEYEQVKLIARETGLPFREVQAEAIRCFAAESAKALSKGTAA